MFRSSMQNIKSVELIDVVDPEPVVIAFALMILSCGFAAASGSKGAAETRRGVFALTLGGPCPGFRSVLDSQDRVAARRFKSILPLIVP